ncbi:uncharacterized protein LOC127095619 [Lathyrus oleraceus]|uniref:uncharacterized protein LOC127095619 n=1 Tax=Pisum sativum TaxID=3888 RepID=UPI0021CF059D|nr:uncharacterized protein LOC127095619 [Pisum sativum]
MKKLPDLKLPMYVKLKHRYELDFNLHKPKLPRLPSVDFVVERKPPPKGPAKKATTTKDAVEEEPTKITTTTKVSRNPPPTPKKRKLKEPQVQVVELDYGNISPDTSKQANKKKRQAKASDSTSQPKVVVTKVQPKKPAIPEVLEVDSEPAAKTTHEWLESDNSSLRAEVSPPKTTTQHSRTSDSDRDEEEEHPIIEVQEDVNMQEVKEDVKEKSNDASPDILDQVEDVSNDEEEQDEDLSMFDIPPVDDQNEQEEDDE